MDLADVRREYLQKKLSEEEVTENPIDQFNIWLQQAVDAKLQDPTAMIVATVDETGQPSQRIVLLKQVKEEGFVFFTNLGSRKAQEIKSNNKISLHFPWHALERQVIVYGEATPLSAKENMAYFLSRPKESQLAAWASEQSRPVGSRQLLMQTFANMKQKFAKGDIPTPDFWGGYLVKPSKMEFWQGGEHRLHDRIFYTLNDDKWTFERLAP
mgnify:CR=1 FL=1